MSFVHPAVLPEESAVQGNGHIITKADELLARWAERDRQYAARLTPLTDREVAVVRQQREFEAGFVEPKRRGPLYVRARHWRAPRPGEWS